MKAATITASIIAGLYATAAWAAPVPLSDSELNQVVAGEDFIIVNKIADQASAGATTIRFSSIPGGCPRLPEGHFGLQMKIVAPQRSMISTASPRFR